MKHRLVVVLTFLVFVVLVSASYGADEEYTAKQIANLVIDGGLTVW